jgi:KDO2-lipid IV(A) lauroyltransferase
VSVDRAASVPWPKRLRRAVRARLVLGLVRAIGLLPRELALALGRGLGWLAFVLLHGERRRALEHLAGAMPELAGPARRRIARDAFVNLGACAAEVAQLERLDPVLPAYVELPDEARALLAAALEHGRGAVLVTAHLGNWELLARRLAREFAGLAVVAREMQAASHLEAMEALRSSGGVRTLWRGRPGATREMLRVFRENRMLGLLIDQDTKVQSVFVPFFGRLASTPRAAGDLSVRMGAPLIGAFIQRRADGGHRIEARLISAATTGDREADGAALTAAATRAIEEAIRARPHEWVWMHRRWKTRPEPGAAAAGAPSSEPE